MKFHFYFVRLKERLEKGEITKEEYKEAKKRRGI
ncbi:MAG TPA: SHOCT domain-containing protein [Bacillota bacterium]